MRIRYSTSVAGFRMNQRRSHTMIASPRPSARMMAAPPTMIAMLAELSRPRTISSRTIGIIRAMTAAASALAAPPTNRQATGLTKGARRQRAAGVESGADLVGRDDEEDMTLRRVVKRT